MSKIITDEQELNTAVGDLVTEDYVLEILGLQSIADFRKFSRSFMKLSKIVKGIETNVDNNLDKKLNKGAVSSEYDTAKKIEDKIKGIEQKFKNFCPYNVGDIYITTKAENPSATWLGTTWQKIEGRFLLGTSSSQASKLTGGSMNKNISQDNLPSVKLTVDSFSLGRGNMDITGSITTKTGMSLSTDLETTGVFSTSDLSGNTYTGTKGSYARKLDFQASRAWTGTTNSASPQTSSLGSGQALDITPNYYTAHMWLRLS